MTTEVRISVPPGAAWKTEAVKVDPVTKVPLSSESQTVVLPGESATVYIWSGIALLIQEKSLDT